MNRISLTEIYRIAHLSRLRFSPEEANDMQKELAKMIDFANRLDPLSASSAASFLPEGGNQNAFRNDTVCPSFSREETLRNAPLADKACFVVPHTVEEENK